VTALLLFASVLLHELGHSFVALQQGIGVKSITLFLFGGLAHLEQESKTPAAAFGVAIAGPVVSLGLYGLLSAIGGNIGLTGPFAAILGVVAAANLALAVFNLIPGLPLDGGNILKAGVWRITGNPYKGTVFASRVGQVLGGIAILSGLLPLVIWGSFANFWNLLIGWFLWQNAGLAAQYATVQNKLTGLTAADALVVNGPMVSEQMTLRELVDRQVMDNTDWRKFLVTNEQGQLIGAIVLEDLKTIPTQQWDGTLVRELAKSVEPATVVSSDRPLLEVMGLLEEKRLSALAVVQESGVLLGLLEKAAIVRLLQGQPQTKSA
jgi:Zn-dependent protease